MNEPKYTQAQWDGLNEKWSRIHADWKFYVIFFGGMICGAVVALIWSL